MKHNEAISYIYEHFEEACFSLFEGLNCDVNFSEKPEDECLEQASIASIDAGSDEMEMRLFLRMPFSVLALTYPGDNVAEIHEEKLEDWMAELSNMLIGKVKAKLLSHGVAIKIGLPESYYGVTLEDIVPEGFESKYYFYDVDGVVVECRIYLDLMVDELDISTSAEEDDTNEGELELF